MGYAVPESRASVRYLLTYVTPTKRLQDDDVAWREGGPYLLDIEPEEVAVDRAVDHPGRVDALWRRAAMKVRDFQWPKGAYPFSRP